jgi:hypothetical protein
LRNKLRGQFIARFFARMRYSWSKLGRQTDKHKDGWMDRQTYIHTKRIVIWTVRQADKRTDGSTDRGTDRQSDGQTDTDKQKEKTDGQTDRRTDKKNGQTDRQTDGH